MLVKKYIQGFIYLFILVFLLSKPQVMILSVKNALYLCYENIIPSLFIFMVFSNYISQTQSSEILSIFMLPYSRIMKINDNKYPTYLFLSAIGGFAVSASLLKAMKDDGYSNKFINVAAVSMTGNSLAFCLYAVGYGMLKNIVSGAMIYISVFSAQLISAFILSFFANYEIQHCTAKRNFSNSFVNSLSKSVNSILIICGYVILFCCVCDAISLYIKNRYISAIICALAEVTNGCIKIVNAFNGNIYVLCTVLCILPISTLLQIYNFTENIEIIKFLIFSRLFVLPISLTILSILQNLFPQYTYTSITETLQIRTGQMGIDISFVLFMISLSFIIIFEKNKLFTKSQV